MTPSLSNTSLRRVASRVRIMTPTFKSAQFASALYQRELMSETNSSSPPNDAPTTHPDSLRALTWEMLAQKLGEEWNKAIDLRNKKNAKIQEIDQKAQTLVARYKAIESKLDEDDKDFLACDILDPKVKDLLIAIENGEYEKPKEVRIYDVIQDTAFESIMGEILLRQRKNTPASEGRY